jgi:hypothetical protein
MDLLYIEAVAYPAEKKRSEKKEINALNADLSQKIKFSLM